MGLGLRVVHHRESWIDTVGGDSICRYLAVASVFVDANLRDPELNRLKTRTTAEISQNPILSQSRAM